MDREIEKNFVENFIKKDKRERIFHELLKKRENFYYRLSHGITEVIDMNKITESGAQLTEECVFQKIQNATTEQECYVIKEYSGKKYAIKEGLRLCFEWLGGSVLITECFAFFKEETYNGAPMKYLLKK